MQYRVGVRSSKITLVAVDDDPQSLALVVAALKRDELEIVTEQDSRNALELVRKRRPQIVLLDLMMPHVSGMELLEGILDADPAIDVILMTAHYSTESAVEAIRRGASDYMNKPLSIDRLRERVDALVAEARRREKAYLLDEQLLDAYSFQGIIGRSPSMLDVFARIRRVAPHFRTALVTGATGTGKELIARALHDLGPVAKGPFVVSNCAAIPDTLVESELFGHMKGSFTGAVADRAGIFEAAHGGTLFLDEIGELPAPAQAKLLRAVQNQEIQRIGSTAVRKVSVRIVCATNRDLRTLAAEKSFREDLYYRLSMVELKLPALAQRMEDLPLLLRHFIDHFAEKYGKPIEGATRRMEAALARHAWPGNIRELENVIGYACMVTDSVQIDVPDLPDHFLEQPQTDSGEHVELVTVDQIQRLHAHRVLRYVGGDKVRAAEILGVSRATLYRLISDVAATSG
jgi:DNA-binding NtrC family response regulator